MGPTAHRAPRTFLIRFSVSHLNFSIEEHFLYNYNMPQSKVTPVPHAKQREQKRDMNSSDERVKERETFVMLLHTLFKRYGGQRHPKIHPFEMLIEDNALTNVACIPPSSKIIYISHEWVGTAHPDPRGDQMYHLLLLLERLQRGDVSRTDMDAFHSLLYKHNYSTTAAEWKHVLDSQTTYIFYDGFSCRAKSESKDFEGSPRLSRDAIS